MLRLVIMTLIDHPADTHIEKLDFYIPDDVLLNARLCDLGVRLEDTIYEPFARKLESELRRVGLVAIKPKFYLADEWFCPSGSTAIAIPFWLAHPRLKELERSFIGQVEGETPQEFMKLLRHEMGHCFEHAYRLSKRADWKRLFGDPTLKYTPDHYQWQRHTKDFVRHLPDGYAQCHPEEDFAETFAVWLNPGSRWREKYQDCKRAIEKLDYVDSLVKQIAAKKPYKLTSSLIASASRTKRKLRDIYRQRLKEKKRH